MQDRDAVLHAAMDQLLSRVRKWRASDGHGASAKDVALAHSGETEAIWRASGLHAWEFHTMLHRAAEYGLVDDMAGLWAEVRRRAGSKAAGGGACATCGSLDACWPAARPAAAARSLQDAADSGTVLLGS